LPVLLYDYQLVEQKANEQQSLYCSHILLDSDVYRIGWLRPRSRFNQASTGDKAVDLAFFSPCRAGSFEAGASGYRVKTEVSAVP
jgi:hypothetical protein